MHNSMKAVKSRLLHFVIGHRAALGSGFGEHREAAVGMPTMGDPGHGPAFSWPIWGSRSLRARFARAVAGQLETGGSGGDHKHPTGRCTMACVSVLMDASVHAIIVGALRTFCAANLPDERRSENSNDGRENEGWARRGVRCFCLRRRHRWRIRNRRVQIF